MKVEKIDTIVTLWLKFEIQSFVFTLIVKNNLINIGDRMNNFQRGKTNLVEEKNRNQALDKNNILVPSS